MKIGLIDVDNFRRAKVKGVKLYPNLALCKIASYHKQRGDIVEWASQFEHYDIIYRAKVFRFTSDLTDYYSADKVISGGTGYNIHSQLPQEIDDCQPDLSIYPGLPQNTSYGFLSRGCPNHCKWCVVPEKEGAVRPYWDIDRVANGNKNIILMDNNILALPDYFIEQANKIVERGYRIDFNQAIDARLVNDDNAKLLAKIRWIHSRIRFGCDTKAQIAECDRAIELIAKYGYKGEFFMYTMLHGDIHECLERINHWRERVIRKQNGEDVNATYVHSQPYRDPHHANCIPMWQNDMASWSNKRQLFYRTSFEEFMPRKNFSCKVYLE